MCSLILVYLFLLQNYLTAINGIQQTKIINSKYKCGKNEVYKRSQICEGFCDGNALECGTSKKNVFVTGCFCKNGYLKDKQNRCVSKRRCFVQSVFYIMAGVESCFLKLSEEPELRIGRPTCRFFARKI